MSSGSDLKMPLSVLDLAPVVRGNSSTDAFRATTALAKRADELGFARFWVAEHHNMNTVASTEPAVLMAHLAANTERIRVGSGGVMLPNHAPLVVAEQFAMLEALYPNRVDLGIGRAPGTDRMTAAALRRNTDGEEEEEFPNNVVDVLGLLGDPRRDHGLHTQFLATPAASSSPQVLLLGSSGFSAQLAGMLGLGFAYAHHFDMGGHTNQAADIYRRHFEPSATLEEPNMVVTAVALAADSREEAEFLSSSHRLRKYGMRTGQLFGLLPPEEALKHPAYEQALQMPSNSHLGTGDEVVKGLMGLAEETGATELMVAIPVTEAGQRVRSLELLAKAWF
jgi:luciferase family oxidoreductase group 1